MCCLQKSCPLVDGVCVYLCCSVLQCVAVCLDVSICCLQIVSMCCLQPPRLRVKEVCVCVYVSVCVCVCISCVVYVCVCISCVVYVCVCMCVYVMCCNIRSVYVFNEPFTTRSPCRTRCAYV